MWAESLSFRPWGQDIPLSVDRGFWRHDDRELPRPPSKLDVAGFLWSCSERVIQLGNRTGIFMRILHMK